MDASFVFDDGGLDSAARDLEAPEPAWDLGGAIESAKAVKRKTKTFSTTDEKIRQTVKRRKGVDDEGDEAAAPAALAEAELDEDTFFSKDSVRSSDARRTLSSSEKTFTELNLSRVLCRACGKLGFESPTPIQVRHATSLSLSLSLSLSRFCDSRVSARSGAASRMTISYHGFPFLSPQGDVERDNTYFPTLSRRPTDRPERDRGARRRASHDGRP